MRDLGMTQWKVPEAGESSINSRRQRQGLDRTGCSADHLAAKAGPELARGHSQDASPAPPPPPASTL